MEKIIIKELIECFKITEVNKKLNEGYSLYTVLLNDRGTIYIMYK